MGACGSAELDGERRRGKPAWVRDKEHPVDDNHPEVFKGQTRKTKGRQSIVFHIHPICPKQVEVLLKAKADEEREAVGTPLGMDQVPTEPAKCPPTPSPTPATLDLKHDLDNISLSNNNAWSVRSGSDLQLDMVGRSYPQHLETRAFASYSQVSGIIKRAHETRHTMSRSSSGHCRSVGMPQKRSSFMSLSSLDSSSHDRRCSSVCSYTMSEGSRSTCLDILHELSAQTRDNSYKTMHEYEINVRPFGMRLTDLVVSHLKGAASKTGIRLGDELEKINGKAVSADTWASVFSTIETPFTITLVRVHKGSIGRSEPSRGYDTETGIARKHPRALNSTPNSVSVDTIQSYNSDNIIAGKIPRHLSPKRSLETRSYFKRGNDPSPRAPSPPLPLSSASSDGSQPRSTPRNGLPSLEPIEETATQTPLPSASPRLLGPPSIPYCSDSIYAGRLRRESSPHKPDKNTVGGEEGSRIKDTETPKGISLVLCETETPTAVVVLDPRSSTDTAATPDLAPGAAESPSKHPPSIDIAPVEAPSHIMENLPDIKLM